MQNAINPVLTAAGLQTGDFSFNVRVNGVLADASTAAAGDRVEVTVTSTWGTVGLRPLGIISSSKVVLGGVSMRREGN